MSITVGRDSWNNPDPSVGPGSFRRSRQVLNCLKYAGQMDVVWDA